MDLFLFQLAIIFIPGIVWERLDAEYAAKRPLDQIDVLRRTFVFGLVSYGLTFGLYRLCAWPFAVAAVGDRGMFLSWHVVQETGSATAVAFVLGVTWLYVRNHKFVPWLLLAIGATKRYGNEDVWDYTFNASDPSVEYVHLRDFERKIVFTGYVDAFSETDKVREILLRDVIAYDFSGNQVLVAPRMYIARPMDNIEIEFPYKANP